MDSRANLPYFPPPPGQVGVPPPLPPRPVSGAAAPYPPPPTSHPPHYPAQHLRTPQNMGGSYAPPPPAAFNDHQPPSHHHSVPVSPQPPGSQAYSPAPWPQHPPQGPTAPYGQQFQANTYSSPVAGSAASVSGGPQSAYRSQVSQTQKMVYNTCLDIRNKALTKMSQYMAQSSQFGAHTTQQTQNGNVNSVPVQPASPTTMGDEQGHNPQTSQYQHAPGLSPAQYSVPLQHQGYQSASIPMGTGVNAPPQHDVAHQVPHLPPSSALTQHQSLQILSALMGPSLGSHPQQTAAHQVHHPTPPAPEGSTVASPPEMAPSTSVGQNYSGLSHPAQVPVPTSQEYTVSHDLNHVDQYQRDASSGNHGVFYGVQTPGRPDGHLNMAQQPSPATLGTSQTSQPSMTSGSIGQTYYPPPPPPASGPPANDHSRSQPQTSQNHAAAHHQHVDPAIDQLSSQIGKVNIQTAPPPAPRPLTMDDEEYHDWKRDLPTFVNGYVPNKIIWECPEQRLVEYETDWYHLPDTSKFLICTWCHEKHLSKTPLSDSLKKVRLPTGRCRFNVPRLTRSLVPEYVRDNDVQPLRDFMLKRSGIQDCHGENGVSGEARVRWFKPLDHRLEGVRSCEACYEDVVLGTGFRQKFVPCDTVQAADAVWACDVCMLFLGRTLVKFPKLPGRTWEDWAQAAAKHMALPRCEKKPVSPTSRRWMRLRGGRLPDAHFCERCFESFLAYTPIQDEFEPAPQQISITGMDMADVILGLRAAEPDPQMCGGSMIPMIFAIYAAIKQKDFGVFLKAAEVIVTQPHCTEAGIAGGKWYTLAGGCDGFLLCVACHAGCIETWGLGRFYELATGLDESQALLCRYHPSSPRFMEYVVRQQEAVETGLWPRYSDWARVFSSIPLCARDVQVRNRKWYGWPDCPVCTDCYVTFCRDSPGRLAMAWDGQPVDEAMCCMYSPRMRQKWTEACARGGPDELLAYARVRTETWVRTVVEARNLRRRQEILFMRGKAAASSSLVYQHLENVKLSAGLQDGYRHGNSTLGWHPTDYGVTGAKFHSEMTGKYQEAGDPGVWRYISQLEARWREVE